MKQILGYIECDYMNIKRGMLYLIGIFTVIGAVFSLKSSTGAVGYMLFGGMILSGSNFITSQQTVLFPDLAPGSTLQKVLGRYLCNLFVMAVLTLLGLMVTVAVRIAGFENGNIDLQLLAALCGISLVFLGLQNMLLYLLIPVTGVQFANIIRMLPGFVLFFLVMQEKTLDMFSRIFSEYRFPGLIVLGVGVLTLVVSVFFSYLIVRGREGK